MHEIDSVKIESQIVHVCDNHILPYYKALTDDQIETKSSANDLVTIADKEAEVALTAALLKMFPQDHVFGEEAVHDNPAHMEVLANKSYEHPIWVIDPVDGTYNFRHGNRHFALMLACVYKGETVRGWIYDILGKSMMSVSKGEGAYLDGNQIHIPQRPKNTDPSEISGHIGYKHLPQPLRNTLKAKTEPLGKISTLGCAAHEYLTLLRGDVDFNLYSLMKPWDHLVGALAVQEAGGYVLRGDKMRYAPADYHKGLLVAGSEDIWHEVYNTLDLGAI